MIMENKDNNLLVSVLLNCYNAEKFISKAIESVIKQTYKNWELIIWDDGSKDSTVDIVKKYQDKRIKIFSKKNNLGLGKSRINAIKFINGALVSILDADDYYHKDKLYKQVEIFKNYPKVGICTTWTKIFNQNDKFIRLFETNLNNEVLKKKVLFLNFLPHSSIMYRKDIAQQVGWYSEQLEYAQDYDLTLKILEKKDIYLIKEHLTYVMLGDTNMSTLKNLKPTVFKENILILKESLTKKDLSERDKRLIKNIIDINLIKLTLIKMKTNFITGFVKFVSILAKNPLIILKLSLLKSLNEQKKL